MDFGDEQDDNGPNIVFLPEKCDVSPAMTLDCFSLLFKLGILSDIWDHTNTRAMLKQDEIWRNRNNLDYNDIVWWETTVEELKALFGMDILIGPNPLPQYILYWHQKDFIGNSGLKLGLGYVVVINLCKYIPGKNHHVCCDMFTSVQLLKDFLACKT